MNTLRKQNDCYPFPNDLNNGKNLFNSATSVNENETKMNKKNSLQRQ